MPKSYQNMSMGTREEIPSKLTWSAPKISIAPSLPDLGPFHTSSFKSFDGQKRVISYPRCELDFLSKTRTESGSSQPVKYQKFVDCRNL